MPPPIKLTDLILEGIEEAQGIIVPQYADFIEYLERDFKETPYTFCVYPLSTVKEYVEEVTNQVAKGYVHQYPELLELNHFRKELDQHTQHVINLHGTKVERTCPYCGTRALLTFMHTKDLKRTLHIMETMPKNTLRCRTNPLMHAALQRYSLMFYKEFAKQTELNPYKYRNLRMSQKKVFEMVFQGVEHLEIPDPPALDA